MQRVQEPSDGSIGLRFLDSWKEPKTQFEQYFRKDLPQRIKNSKVKHDNNITFKSYKPSAWTDRSNKFGPIYSF